VAKDLSGELKIKFSKNEIFMTAGSANALNILSRVFNNPKTKTEIICVAPYFVEYNYYIRNYNGNLVLAQSDENFDLDLNNLEKSITRNTKAIIINSPNNPTGIIYSESKLKELAGLLDIKNKKLNKEIIVIEDAVYNKMIWEDNKFFSILNYYPNSFHVNSFSKSLGLAGERIGYFAVNPDFKKNHIDWKNILGAFPIILRSNVINSPGIQQKVIQKIGCNLTSDLGIYKKKIDLLSNILSESGFEFRKPQGTFYIWAKIPGIYEDSSDFMKYAIRGKAPLFAVPGKGFGGRRFNKYLRFSVSDISEEDIQRTREKLNEMNRRKLKSINKKKKN
ncbi:aminotransferase class I/II-fold pyridoxal phosphate-dependent enzyme, partial [Candidatus Pacearchaeota archaeon]|nr:aminotransferase class I/II-fold pyridoxal phosphate-dependent enzyme [Candidatus Pacearchaeota archaeon]